uniref:MSP domain-containing protein n=1 Tax=Caenorhabditis japonica TaxID=281687 RepID=A0A8R1DEC4_CAEJA
MMNPDRCIVEPTMATVPASGGTSIHQIISESDSRMAFKVKMTNIEEYRVRPVYGFVEPRGRTKLEILRLEGTAKDDRLAIQYAEVPAEETDVQAPFKAGAQQGEAIIEIRAVTK